MIPDELLRERGLGALHPRDNPNPPKAATILLASVADHPIPQAVDYTQYFRPVRSQSITSECVCFAQGGLMEFLTTVTFSRECPSLSPQELYNRIKAGDGNTYDGTWDSAACELLKTEGMVLEDDYLFNIDKDRKDVPPTVSRRTFEYMLDDYGGGSNRAEMVQALGLVGPCTLGIEVRWAFDAVGSDGHVTMALNNQHPDYMRGGHDIVAVGYDQDKGWVKVRNSWGPLWGDGGYGFIDFDWLDAYMTGYTTVIRDYSHLMPEDLDGDSRVTHLDVQRAIMAAVGMEQLSPTLLALADVKHAGRVTVGDVIAILRKAV